MIETLIGTFFGGLFRMAPELLKWFDRKDERRHELSMFDKQLTADAQRGKLAIDQIDAQNAGTLGVAEIEALVAATKAQGKGTGIKFVDAISALMRPLITFWWVIVMYSVALACEYVTLTRAGISYTHAILELWGPDEKAIAASIISFWFVDRSLRKGFGK